MRRSALPSVWPKPRSSGSATSVAKRVASWPAVTCSLFGRISSCQFFWIVTVFHPWASRRGDDVTGVGDLAGKSPAALQSSQNSKSRRKPPATSKHQTRRRLRGRQPLCGLHRYVDPRCDGEARRLQRTKRRFTARAGACNFNFQRAHAVFLRLLGDVFSGNLRGIGGRLARTLETHRARRRPGNGITLCVGDGDGGVVERRIHMRHTGSDVLALAAAYAGGILAHLKNLSNDLNAAVMPAATPVRRVVSSEWRIELFATPYSPFALLLLLAGDRLGRPLARAGVGMGALTAHRQPAAMAQAAIAAEVHQTLDVHADFATKIALDQIVAVDHFADLQHFLVAQLADATVSGNLDLLHDVSGMLLTDAMDVLERDHHALVGRDIHTGNTGHELLSCRRSLKGKRPLSFARSRVRLLGHDLTTKTSIPLFAN